MLWFKALHVIAVIAWMAALLYLPRLMVYHADSAAGSAQAETFKVMERRLLNAIATPAMIVSWAAGLILAFVYQTVSFAEIWVWTKAGLVVGLTGYHMWLIALVRAFSTDANARPARFFRIINEIPTVMMIGIVIMVIVRPF